MTTVEPAAASFRFSTRELAPPSRLTALRELFDQSVQLTIDAEPGHAVEMEMVVTPGLRRARMVSALTARMARPAQMLADGEDTVCLMMKTGGRMSLAQGRRESVPQAGDGVLLVYREPAVLNFEDATYVSVRVPFSAIAPIVSLQDAAGRCIPSDCEALSLLQRYLAQLPERICNPQLGRLSAMHVYDLIALAIGATKEGRELAGTRSARAIRLDSIKADIVHDTTLDLDQIAARHSVSPRYIQMLFQETGTTFSAFALDVRLDTAHRLLISPRFASRSIADIAFEAGFSDLSHFNRCFKRRFSMTPTDRRRQTSSPEPL